MKLFKYNQFIKESNEDIDSICEKYNIHDYTINEDVSVDVDGNVDIYNEYLDKPPLKFRNISGFFDISRNKLTSLEGCPQNVRDYFYCQINQLTSLKGGPQSVGGSFYCNRNELTSLEGGPKSVGGGFICSDNKLTSLEGCPQSIVGAFYCENNQIRDFKGFPEYFEGNISFNGNPVDEILKLFKYHKKSIDWINEHDVIQGNKVILQRLEEVAYELKIELPNEIKLKNYEII